MCLFVTVWLDPRPWDISGGGVCRFCDAALQGGGAVSFFLCRLVETWGASWPIKGRTAFRVVSIEVTGAWIPADGDTRQTTVQRKHSCLSHRYFGFLSFAAGRNVNICLKLAFLLFTSRFAKLFARWSPDCVFNLTRPHTTRPFEAIASAVTCLTRTLAFIPSLCHFQAFYFLFSAEA